MCGFNAVINFNGDLKKLDSAFEYIKYRGQIHGKYSINNSHFYATRLPRSGNETRKQPIVTENSVLLFNGEIYNIEVLCKKYGIQYSPKNIDSEYFILLIEIHGIKIISELIGEFSFVIYFIKKQKIVFARDRLGTKPLFWKLSAKSLYISSSAKAINFACNETQINHEVVYDYLFYGVSKSATIYSDINNSESGNIYIFDKFLNKKKYNYCIEANPSEDNLEISINNSVNTRLNKKTYIAYSGGVDSELIRKYAGHGIPLYSLETPYEKIDRLTNANIIRPEWRDIDILFEKYTDVAETPITSLSGIALLHMNQIAKSDGYENVISGEGADEIFYGYNYYYYRSKHHPLLHKRHLSRQFLENLFEIRSDYKMSSLIDVFSSNMPSVWAEFDLKYRLPNHLFRLNSDIPSLLAGIEARVPFLDLFDYYNPKYMNYPEPKHILKLLLKEYKIKNKIGLYYPASIMPNFWFVERLTSMKNIDIEDKLKISSNKIFDKLIHFFSNYHNLSDTNKEEYYYHISRWTLGIISLANMNNSNKQNHQSSILKKSYTELIFDNAAIVKINSIEYGL